MKPQTTVADLYIALFAFASVLLAFLTMVALSAWSR